MPNPGSVLRGDAGFPCLGEFDGPSESSASLIARTETAPNSVEKKAPNNVDCS
jgi:hypothetical protein